MSTSTVTGRETRRLRRPAISTFTKSHLLNARSGCTGRILRLPRRVFRDELRQQRADNVSASSAHHSLRRARQPMLESFSPATRSVLRGRQGSGPALPVHPDLTGGEVAALADVASELQASARSR